MSDQPTVDNIRGTLDWIEALAHAICDEDATIWQANKDRQSIALAWQTLASEIRRAPELAAQACERQAEHFLADCEEEDEEGEDDA